MPGNKALVVGMVVAALMRPAWCEEPPQQQVEPRTAVTEAPKESAPAQKPQPAAKDKKATGTFIPSEEISEDLSVPFPVDI